ncbi:hypothetical protein ABIB94_001347 [Bradyrhizobium sp. JR7.2]
MRARGEIGRYQPGLAEWRMNMCRMDGANVQTALSPLMVRSAPLRASRTIEAQLLIRASPFETPAAQAPQGEGIEFACLWRSVSRIVMAGLVPAIHALTRGTENVDARAFASPKRLRPRRRDKPGHDDHCAPVEDDIVDVSSRASRSGRRRTCRRRRSPARASHSGPSSRSWSRSCGRSRDRGCGRSTSRRRASC